MSENNKQDEQRENFSGDYMFGGAILTRWWHWVILLIILAAWFGPLIIALTAYTVHTYLP